METNALTSTSADTNPAQSTIDRQKLGGDFNQFLLLLTTQLQNQDPTSPLDTSQMTQQIIGLSTVEQAIATNKNLETLISMNTSGQLTQAAGYIGKYIDAEGSSGVLNGDYAQFAYELPKGASTAQIAILDQFGRVVYTGNGPAKEGKNIVYWDGVNSFNGTDAPYGVYKIAVTAKDANGKALETKTFSTGRVTAVDLEDGNITLSLGGVSIPLSQVLAVREGLPT